MAQATGVFCDTVEARYHLKTLLDRLGESLRLLETMTDIDDVLMGLNEALLERRRSAKDTSISR